MKIRLLLFIFLVYVVPAFSQQGLSDSLRHEWNKTTSQATKLELENLMGEAIYSAQPDSAVMIWKRVVKKADELKSKSTPAELDRVLRTKGNALNNIAFVYINRGMLDLALEYNFKSLKLRDSINDTHGIAESQNNIAYLYSTQHDTAGALDYYSKSAANYAAIKDFSGVAFTLVNRGEIYLQLNKDSLALQMFFEALQILGKDKVNHRGFSTCLMNVGKVYTRQGNFIQGKKYLDSSLTVRITNADLRGEASSYSNLGKLYQQKGIKDSAIYFGEKGFNLAVKMKSPQTVIVSSKLLYEVYSSRNDFENALKYYKTYVATRDSVSGEEQGKEMVRQKMGYEYSKKIVSDSLKFEQEKEVGNIKLERQRAFTIGGFSALAIVALLLFFVYRQRNGIAREKKRSDELLLNILPAETAEELKATGSATAKSYESVTVLFTDFKNFTQTAEAMSPVELVAIINFCYGNFDRIVSANGVEKIKTIGDAYMCAGGLPIANTTHAEDTVKAAIEMLAFVKATNEERKKENKPFFDIRIGLHTGPVVAGVVGTKKIAYDIWGDAVNIASRMESSGEAGRINISASTYELVKNKYPCEHRGKITAKNKGEIDMYFVN